MSVVVDTVNYIGEGWNLGNHFFQFATGYAFSKKTGRKLILPKSNLHQEYEHYGKPYVYNDWYASWLPNVDDIPKGRLALYKEPFHAYKEIPSSSADTVILSGYFQSSKYFASYKEELKNLFQPTQEIKDLCQSKYGHFMFGDPNFVVVHARRTDYLKPQNLQIHNPLPPQYYLNAFEEIKKHVPNPFFILLSDDSTFWNELTITAPFAVIDEPNSAISLYFMTHFKNYIIANSTFSWWGAYLSKHSETVVVAPEKWFGPAGPQDYQDTYEPEWIKVGQV
jgi:hypothetical protein